MKVKSDMTYLGRVVYMDDPTFSGRCKVKVFGVFDDLEEQYIPWFIPANNGVFGTSGAGSISVPKLGDIVRVKFANGDIYAGEYFGCQTMDPDLIEEIKDDYPDTQVLMYDSEKDMILSYQNLSGIRMYLKGSEVKVDADGTIQVRHKNNTNIVEVKDDEINIATAGDGTGNNTGNINITAGSTVNISAPTVNVQSENVALGNNPTFSAVKGEKLVDALRQIAGELAMKYPQFSSALMGRTFEEILSTSVRVTE